MVSADEKAARHQWFQSLSVRERAQWQRQKNWENALEPDFGAALAARARRRMARCDELPTDVRRVVHEHGLEITWEFWTYGVKKGHVINVLVKASQGADDPDSRKLANLYRAHGIYETRRIAYLIGTCRNDPHPDGTNRFRLNSSPSRKANLLNDDLEDGVGYYVAGPHG